MMTTDGQVIGTPTGTFPQQILHGLFPTNANKFVILAPYAAAPTQQFQSNFSPETYSQTEKINTFQNQSQDSNFQALYGYHFRATSQPQDITSQPQVITSQPQVITSQPQVITSQPQVITSQPQVITSQSQVITSQPQVITSQPQIVTAQALGTAINQAQILGLQTANVLPPGSPWPSSGLNFNQNPCIIYSQPSSAIFHQIQPQMAMKLPVTPAAPRIPTTISSAAATQKKKIRLLPKGTIVQRSSVTQQYQLLVTPVAKATGIESNPVSVAKATSVECNPVSVAKDTGIESDPVSAKTTIFSLQNSQETVVQGSVASLPAVDASVSMAPSNLTIGSNAEEKSFAPNSKIITLNAEVNHMPSTSIEMSDAGIETCPHPIQVSDDLTKSTGIESKTVSVEAKIPLPQKSPAPTPPFSKIPQASITSTANAIVESVTPSTLTTGSSTDASLSPSSIQRLVTHAEIHQQPSYLVMQQNTEECNEKKSVSVETDISSHQKSQADVDISAVSVLPSTLNVASSIVSVMTRSSVSSDVSTFSVPAVSPVSAVPCLENRLSDFNSRPSSPKVHDEVVAASHQTDTTKIMETDEPLKPQQLIQELSLKPVKENPLTASVKPRVLNHIINGFIIQESTEPFPVSQKPLLNPPYRVLPPPKKLKLSEEKENSPTAPNTENEMRALKPQVNLKLAGCPYCRKKGPKFKFNYKKRFCSKSCAKEFNKHASKNVKKLVQTTQGRVHSGGRGRKRGRKRKHKQLPVEDEGTDATPSEEIPSTSENELVISCKTDDENSEPSGDSHHTPMEVDKSTDEVKLVKSDLFQKSPYKWTVQDVFEFIQSVPGCSEYADNFKSQEIDGQSLLLLTEDHLKTALNMKLGPALKLLSHIRSIKAKLLL